MFSIDDVKKEVFEPLMKIVEEQRLGWLELGQSDEGGLQGIASDGGVRRLTFTVGRVCGVIQSSEDSPEAGPSRFMGGGRETLLRIVQFFSLVAAERRLPLAEKQLDALQILLREREE